MSATLVRSDDGMRNPTPPDWRSILAEFPDDVRDAWEERAAIIQYGVGEPGPAAERRAFECVVSEFADVFFWKGGRLEAVSDRATGGEPTRGSMTKLCHKFTDENSR